MDNLLDLYSDYLISSFGPTTATGLATWLKGDLSHDHITRFLAGQVRPSADLWQIVKPFVRRIQSDQAALIVDDSISEKPSTDENDIVCWHSDHAHPRTKASTFSRRSITIRGGPPGGVRPRRQDGTLH